MINNNIKKSILELYDKAIIFPPGYYDSYGDPNYMTFSYKFFLELLTLFRENNIYISTVEVYVDGSYMPPDFYYNNSSDNSSDEDYNNYLNKVRSEIKDKIREKNWYRGRVDNKIL